MFLLDEKLYISVWGDEVILMAFPCPVSLPFDFFFPFYGSFFSVFFLFLFALWSCWTEHQKLLVERIRWHLGKER